MAVIYYDTSNTTTNVVWVQWHYGESYSVESPPESALATELDADIRIALAFAAFLGRLQAAVWRRRAYVAIRRRSPAWRLLRRPNGRFRAYARRNGRPRQRSIGLNYSKARQ